MRPIKFFLIAAALLLYAADARAATQLGRCASVTGASPLCSTGYNSTGAKVTWAIVTDATGTNAACPTASPATTFTKLTFWGITGSASLTLCYSLSPTTGNLQTFTAAGSTVIAVFSYDTFAGAFESASDLGGCFYAGGSAPCNGSNVSTKQIGGAFTPTSGDLIFVCLYENTAGADTTTITTDHDANFTGSAMSTAWAVAGGATNMLCKWGEYNSTTVVKFTGGINNAFGSVIAMGAVQATSAATTVKHKGRIF